MAQTIKDIGHLIRKTRKSLGVTQTDLALTCNTSQRFISELENGKETCEVGRVLDVLQALGIHMTLTPPSLVQAEGADGTNT